MELRHLRYFREIAHELSYSKAAKKLHVAQPALSVRIKDLEQELGVLLFRRLGPRIELTPAGAVLLRHVEHLLEGLETAITLTRRASDEGGAQLSVGFVGSASYSFLPVLLRDFRARHPGVTLQLQEMSTIRQIEALTASKIDIGFLRLPVLDKALRVEIVHREPFVLAVPRAHPAAGLNQVDLATLVEEPFILFPPGEGAGFHDQIVLMCRAFGFTPRVVQYASPMQNVVGLVGAGMGLAIVPRSVAKIQTPDVSYVEMPENLPQAETAAAWRADNASDLLIALLQSARAVTHFGNPSSSDHG